MRGSASYGTASRRLSLEVQHLLLRLGIVARRYRRVRSYKGRKLEHYVVTVMGEEPLRRFWKLIGRRFLDPRKREQSRALAVHRNARMSRDIIPAEARRLIRRERDVIRRLAAVLHSSALSRLSESDIYWDKVVEIEASGEQPTYDLRIEGDHNFLANNMVVHNSHACSFALLVYDSAWLKYHEPAVFTCALLNSQPMGFYAPAQLVRDAREHGVEVRPVRVDASEWDCTLEPCGPAPHNPAPDHPAPRGGLRRHADASPRTRDLDAASSPCQPALRLGLRLVKSLSQAAAERIAAARAERPFASVQDLARRAALDRGDLEALAAAGALAPLSGNRHLAFWEVAGAERPLALERRPPTERRLVTESWPVAEDRVLAEDRPLAEGRPMLTAPTERESIEADYASVGLTLGRHPMALLRERLRRERILSAAELSALPDGRLVRTAGIVLLRQHPASAKGVIFMTLEDETGQVNLIVWRKVGESQRRPLVESRLLEVRGRLQRQGEIMHVVAQRLIDRSELAAGLAASSRDFH